MYLVKFTLFILNTLYVTLHFVSIKSWCCYNAVAIPTIAPPHLHIRPSHCTSAVHRRRGLWDAAIAFDRSMVQGVVEIVAGRRAIPRTFVLEVLVIGSHGLVQEEVVLLKKAHSVFA